MMVEVPPPTASLKDITTSFFSVPTDDEGLPSGDIIDCLSTSYVITCVYSPLRGPVVKCNMRCAETTSAPYDQFIEAKIAARPWGLPIVPGCRRTNLLLVLAPDRVFSRTQSIKCAAGFEGMDSHRHVYPQRKKLSPNGPSDVHPGRHGFARRVDSIRLTPNILP